MLELHRAGLVGSMGRVGAAGDNAAMESFFALLQKNVLNTRPWATRQELRLAIVTWIERTYHRRRRQRSLGRLTPVEFEAIMTTRAASAAQEEDSPKPLAVPTTWWIGRPDDAFRVEPKCLTDAPGIAAVT